MPRRLRTARTPLLGTPPWRHPHVRHLRLPFNLLLSPIYLYGLLAASLRPSPGGTTDVATAVLGWLSLHVFLYGGATAFNSYYDRDEGPVGGMLRPPAVDRRLLPFSLFVQAAGLPLAALVGPAFLAAWLLLALLFVAYSHPTVRLKARPAAALSAIGLGQGALGFVLGSLAGAPLASIATGRAVLGMAATVLVVTGLYVVTQSYQTLEDRARGDRTLPVLLGAKRALRTAVAALTAGGGLLISDLWRVAGSGVGLSLTAFFVAIGLFLLRWAARFDEDEVTANYRRAMLVAITAGAGLSATLVAVLVGVALESPHAPLIP